MAAFPASLLLLLSATFISGYVLVGDDDNEIVWPTEYHFDAEKLNFETTLKTPIEMWYSAELNRSRVDFYGGTNKKYFYGDEGTMYTLFPVVMSSNMTSEQVCMSMSFQDEQVDFLPDVSDLTFTGQTMTLFDKIVDIWTGQEEYEENMIREKTLYVYKTDHGYDIPIQQTMKTFNMELGDLTGHVVVNYYNFRDAVTEEELTVDEDTCFDEGRLGENFKKDLAMLHPDIPQEVDIAFESFLNHHDKVYREKEIKMRKNIFEKNWRMVHEHNRQNLGYRLEINGFSDKTAEELKVLAGTIVSKQPVAGVQPFPHTVSEIEDIVAELPESFDLRLEGAVTPIKNQGGCGSCWAFCTTAAVEGAVARVNGDRLLDLSEQSLVDCAWDYGSMGCHGGTLDGALKYVYEHGIPTERDYGIYTEHDGFCEINNMTSKYDIKGFAQVTPRNPNALKVALYKYGPVTIAIHASDQMVHYSSGLFYDFSCDSTYPNHGVTVVGYGVRDGEDYWIVKNSWGEAWGEDGYILMSSRNNNCYVLDSPYYPIV
ncbi:cathepsin L-like peptidase [Anticarsia gemmatalis]|uniref:cathepsin L-like peptidase n=1 Tax=Anticarsia gemmatalis TaxID=129554 RepID=UPI003F771887